MKIIFTLIILLTFGVTTSSYAAEKSIIVHINGLVCDFCARSLEKVFGKQEEVESVKVDLEKKIITLNFKDTKDIDNMNIIKLITDAGYNVVGIDREGESK